MPTVSYTMMDNYHSFYDVELHLSLAPGNGTCTSYFLFGFGSVERVTYRKLKRKAIILEYLQKVKVVEGTNLIQKVPLFIVLCYVWFAIVLAC